LLIAENFREGKHVQKEPKRILHAKLFIYSLAWLLQKTSVERKMDCLLTAENFNEET
jgi:hypothetical protein